MSAGEIVSHVRFGWRQARRRPLLSGSIIAVMGLGIGASTAVFSVVDSLLLRSLPYPDAERIGVLWERNPSLGLDRLGVSGPAYLDWRERSKVVESFAAMEIGTGTLTGAGEPRQVPGMRVSANYFEVTGGRAAIGRLFNKSDGEGGFKPLAVLTWETWQNFLGGDPGVIGRKLNVDLIPYTIIGVVERGFWLPVRCDAFVVWPEQFLRESSRASRPLAVLGKLRAGETFERAQSELDSISAGIAREHPEMKGWQAGIVPMQRLVTEPVRPALLALLAAVGLVLVMACANVANLLLAQSMERHREVGVRMALGAPRGKILQQALIESVILSVAGGALGVILAGWMVDGAARFLPATVKLEEGAAEFVLREIQVSPVALLVCAGLSVLTGILFGAAPASQALRTDLRTSLAAGGRSATSHGGPLRSALLAVQVVVTVVLLGGAGVLLRSAANLRHADPGFKKDGLLTLEIELPTDTRYRERATQARFFREASRRIAEIPGVVASGFSSVLPFTPNQDHVNYRPEKEASVREADGWGANLHSATPGLLAALGLTLKQGRFIEEADTYERPLAAVIDETLAHRHWPNVNPIGERILLGASRRPAEIVGVVGRVQQKSLMRVENPTIYVAEEQRTSPRMGLALRAQGNPMAMLDAVKKAIWAVDSDIPVYRVQTMEQAMESSTLGTRITLILTAAFAVAALLLASVGVYGIVAWQTAVRGREFALRVAMGAQPAAIVGVALRSTAIPVLSGLAGGLLLAAALLPRIGELVYGVPPADAPTLAVVAVVLTAVALVAALGPAVRAGRVDAAAGLRNE
jgi:predicted permease